MHILVVGASGRTGQLVVAQALSRGHTVTALVRNPAAFHPPNVDLADANLSVVQGTPLSADDVTRVFDGLHKIEGVAIALNTTRTSDMPWVRPTSEPTMIADAVRNITSQMQKQNVRPISFVSSWGVGSSFPTAPFLIRFIMTYTSLFYTVEALGLAEDALRGSDTDYVICRPSGLSDGKGEGQYKVVEDCVGARFFVDRALIARFCLDALEKEDWKRKSVVVS